MRDFVRVAVIGMAMLVAGSLCVSAQTTEQKPAPEPVFDLGRIVVTATPDSSPGVGGAVLTARQLWNFDRNALDQAVNVVPGVVSNFDANGRRNESDIFVRGFGRWQVPLMLVRTRRS